MLDCIVGDELTLKCDQRTLIGTVKTIYHDEDKTSLHLIDKDRKVHILMDTDVLPNTLLGSITNEIWIKQRRKNFVTGAVKTYTPLAHATHA